MNHIYQHPDGEGEIRFDAETSRLFLLNEAEGLSAYALIGPWGLRDVAAKLLALADDDNADSEQAGAGIALACLDTLLAAKDSTQGLRIRAVQSAIAQLSTTGDPKAAAAGFAVIVENVLSRGMGVHP